VLAKEVPIERFEPVLPLRVRQQSESGEQAIDPTALRQNSYQRLMAMQDQINQKHESKPRHH